jgi:hypothetical protein
VVTITAYTSIDMLLIARIDLLFPLLPSRLQW